MKLVTTSFRFTISIVSFRLVTLFHLFVICNIVWCNFVTCNIVCDCATRTSIAGGPCRYLNNISINSPDQFKQWAIVLKFLQNHVVSTGDILNVLSVLNVLSGTPKYSMSLNKSIAFLFSWSSHIIFDYLCIDTWVGTSLNCGHIKRNTLHE